MDLSKYFNIDCNKCRHINITENEQVYNEPHICTFYNKRVMHRVTHRGQTLAKLFPCPECIADNFMYSTQH